MIRDVPLFTHISIRKVDPRQGIHQTVQIDYLTSALGILYLTSY